MQQQTENTFTERVKKIPSWYHRIGLPDGTITPGWAPINAERYAIPDDLTGKRVLDIGAWDGYWTFEALKRGASQVVAIDDFSDDCGSPERIKRTNKWETFDLCREAFGFTDIVVPDVPAGATWTSYSWKNKDGQICTRREMSVYDIEQLGRFDIVFFFGTIYHLKNPFDAIEKISKVCDGALYIETASLDEYSPYRGGIGAGFDRNETVMEFYPGAEYGKNPSNWWVPTLQCLGAMMAAAGFMDIECWPLTEKPKDLSECRGFASGTKDPAKEPAGRPAEIESHSHSALGAMKVAAVMSVPRLGFMDNSTCACEALWPLKIPIINIQGAFWGQCLERGIQQLIDAGVDIVLTIDYDTLFKRKDVEDLLRLIYQHPEATAVVPLQCGRGNFPLLMSMKSKSGQVRKDVPITELSAETLPIATGHFGLTALRVKELLDVPHPWFWDQPNKDNQWGPGRIDADIWFWKQLEKAGKLSLLACHVTIGHLQIMGTWPDKNLRPIYQSTSEFHEKGKPENSWK